MPRYVCGQNTKRYSHPLLFALITLVAHTTVTATATATANNLNFLQFFFVQLALRIFISFALVLLSMVYGLWHGRHGLLNWVICTGQVFRACDDSLWALESRINRRVRSIEAPKETDVEFYVWLPICRNTCNVGCCHIFLFHMPRILYAVHRTIYNKSINSK